MFDVVVARFKVELGVPASFAAPAFPTRGRAVGDFALAAAEEPTEVFVDPSVPDFNFFCRYSCQQSNFTLGEYNLTCMLMVSM